MSRVLVLGFVVLNFVISEIMCTETKSSSSFKFQLPEASVNPFFGRESFLKRFDDLLQKEGVIVITGIEGVGKTETVLQYIHAPGSTSSYDNHIWLDGETVESLKEGFWKLSQLLDTNPKVKGQAELYTTKELAAIVYEKIQNQLKGTTLLVFDNVDTKSVDILELLPEMLTKPETKTKDKKYDGKIYFVIISRNIAADWKPVTRVPLNPFVFPEILEILLDQLGFVSKSEREELENFFMERLSAASIFHPWSTLQIPLVVEFIKQRTLHHMDKMDAEMNKMESFVTAIQDYFNQQTSEVKPEPESEKKANGTSESETHSHRQSKPETVKLERDNIKMLEKHADSLERDGEIEGALEMTQAIAYSQKMALGEEHEETLDSREKIARLLTKLEQYDEALSIYQNVYQIRKRDLGPAHFQTIETLEGVAGVLVLMEEWEEALALLEEAYDWNKRVLGEDHPKTVVSLKVLLRAKKELGQTDDEQKKKKDEL